MTNISHSIIDLVGNTPLIRLNNVSKQTDCEIFGKAEFLNPGQSVKDRAALSIIRAAEKNGSLQKGGTIVEGTAGNTGIGLAMIGNALGYKCIIVIPETQSAEKKNAIKAFGAKLIEVPAVPYKDDNNYIHVSRRLAETTPSAIWANQFDNIANALAHEQTTGPEIWQQTNGKIDGFICACGSGGTLAGTAKFLRSQNPNIQIGLADPCGANLYHYYKHGELKNEGSSITEGIGQIRITKNLEDLKIDHPFMIEDKNALPYIYDLIENEGLVLGGSSAINIAGAVRLARTLGKGKTIVTILCDYGTRYQDKLFNAKFLREQNLPVPKFLQEENKINVPII